MPDLNSNQICSYVQLHLEKNPQAMDTARGIARWWVGNGSCPTEVEQELERMVVTGKLECVRDGQRVLYRLPIPAAP